MPEKYAAREACAQRIPVLREFPAKYKIVGSKTMPADREQNMRYEACVVGADAVVIVVKTNPGSGRQGKPTIDGVFIRHVDP